MNKKLKLELLNEIDKAVDFLNKKCACCGSGLIEYEEWSPDFYPHERYFCSKKCYNKWNNYLFKKGILHRSSGLTKMLDVDWEKVMEELKI